MAVASLGLDLQVIPVPDGQGWGGPPPSGSGPWSGLMGALQTGQADIGWANLFITEQRKELFDFTDGYNSDDWCAMVKKPGSYPKVKMLGNVKLNFN